MDVIHVPMWIVIAVWGLLLAFIGYVWNRLESRVNKMEKERDEVIKKAIEGGPPLTEVEHERLCKDIARIRTEAFKVMLKETEDKMTLKFENISVKIDALEKAMLLSIENAILKSGATGRRLYKQASRRNNGGK